MTTTLMDPSELPDDVRKHVITKKDGVGAYALYLDFALYNKTTGVLIRQDRKLLVSRLLCHYTRQSGNKRAAWKTHVLANHESAREMLLKSISRMENYGVGVELLHPPILVEMTQADIEAIGKNEAPVGRHAAVAAVEKAIGKMNDETWRPKGTPGSPGVPTTTATSTHSTSKIEIDGTEYEVPSAVLDSLADEPF